VLNDIGSGEGIKLPPQNIFKVFFRLEMEHAWNMECYMHSLCKNACNMQEDVKPANLAI